MKDPLDYRYLPPRLAEQIRSFRMAVRRPVHGQREGRHRSPHHGSSVEFAEYREYTPGDPIQLLDWAVYARSDRHVIRQYHEATNLRAYVLLDTSRSLLFRDRGPVAKIDYAASLAAGLMFIFVNQGDSVSLMTFDATLQRVFEPVGTVEGLRPLLRALEAIVPAGRGDIEAALHTAAERIPSKSLVIVISDLLDRPDRVMRGIRHLHHNGHNILILQVLDPGELNLSFAGVVELRDLETGGTMVVDADEVRPAYESALARYFSSLKAGFSDCLADYHLMDTDRPVVQALHDLQAGATARG